MLAAQITTAHDTFMYAAGLIATGLAPAARAAATAATFRELAPIAGDLPLTPADLATGLGLLAQPHSADEPGQPVSDGDPQRLAEVQRVIARQFAGAQEPRYSAIANTAAREAAELSSAAGSPL